MNNSEDTNKPKENDGSKKRINLELKKEVNKIFNDTNWPLMMKNLGNYFSRLSRIDATLSLNGRHIDINVNDGRHIENTLCEIYRRYEKRIGRFDYIYMSQPLIKPVRNLVIRHVDEQNYIRNRCNMNMTIIHVRPVKKQKKQ
jgi:hypothetical protein